MNDAPAMSVIVLDPRDNVAVAIRDLAPGETITAGESRLVVTHSIPFGHKIAVMAIAADEDVYKYGEPIGHATAEILKGDHVHTHNLVGNRLGVTL